VVGHSLLPQRHVLHAVTGARTHGLLAHKLLTVCLPCCAGQSVIDDSWNVLGGDVTTGRAVMGAYVTGVPISKGCFGVDATGAVYTLQNVTNITGPAVVVYTPTGHAPAPVPLGPDVARVTGAPSYYAPSPFDYCAFVPAEASSIFPKLTGRPGFLLYAAAQATALPELLLFDTGTGQLVDSVPVPIHGFAPSMGRPVVDYQRGYVLLQNGTAFDRVTLQRLDLRSGAVTVAATHLTPQSGGTNLFETTSEATASTATHTYIYSYTNINQDAFRWGEVFDYEAMTYVGSVQLDPYRYPEGGVNPGGDLTVHAIAGC
jgi:hypothetical protein